MSEQEPGSRWGVTFLCTNTSISAAGRMNLVREATEMYLDKEEERRVRFGGYEGILCTRWKYDVLGSFAGVRFDADVDTEDGRAHLRFLVSELTAGQGLAYTQN